LRPADGESQILNVDHLSVRFTSQRSIFTRTRRTIRAVDDVSFELKEGEVLSLVGESGSGKTTIARTILRLAKPSDGTVSYLGKDIAAMNGEELKRYRKDVQIVYQDPFESMNPRQSALSTLEVPLRYLVGMTDPAKIREKASQGLSEVGLDPRDNLRKLPHQMSGGERQRVNIARALATDPKVLIADEPITMLDASQRLNCLTLLSDLRNKRGLSVLLITHDLASAKIMSDRTAVMYRGKIVELGSTASVLSKPVHPYTELIIASTPRLRTKSEGIGVISADENTRLPETGCSYRLRCRYATTVCESTVPQLEAKLPSHLASCHNSLNVAN
jgi:oligopeptide/dipeptide ABC transporter ATP-binding protein